MRTEEQLQLAMRTPGRIDLGLDTATILRSARRRLLAQRVGAGALAAGVVSACVLAWPSGATTNANEPVTQPIVVSPSPSVSPAVLESPAEVVSSPPRPILALGEESVDLGDGWAVSVMGSQICTHTPPELGPPDQCVSTTDGNRSPGDIGMHGTSYTDASSAIQVLYSPDPTVAETVAISAPGRPDTFAQVVHFEAVPGWSYYFHLERFPEGAPPSDFGGTVTAYDVAGQPIARIDASPSGLSVPETAPSRTDAPADTYWTVIVASEPNTEDGRHVAEAQRERLLAAGYTGEVFLSDTFASLRPGYWVAASGAESTREAILTLVDQLRNEGFEIAYPRCVGAATDCPGPVS